MNDLMALRLYFPHSARAPHSSLWHHIARPALTTHLIRLARREGIAQAIIHHVESGYLPDDDRVRHRHVEHPHPKLPQCLELIDSGHKIQAFIDRHGKELANVRALLMPCQRIPSSAHPAKTESNEP
jgi:PII-like signaling protein